MPNTMELKDGSVSDRGGTSEIAERQVERWCTIA